MGKSQKSSMELRRRIKKAESEKREKAMRDNPVTIITGGDDSDKITFEQWWMIINRKVKMRTHLKEILLVDFQSRGLTKSEPESKYNEALRVFGIKW